MLYPLRSSWGISDIPSRHPRCTKSYEAMKNTADVTGGKPIAVLLQSISGVSAINPLVAFILSFIFFSFTLFFSHRYLKLNKAYFLLHYLFCVNVVFPIFKMGLQIIYYIGALFHNWKINSYIHECLSLVILNAKEDEYLKYKSRISAKIRWVWAKNRVTAKFRR
jgi:hypothetical protein